MTSPHTTSVTPSFGSLIVVQHSFSVESSPISCSAQFFHAMSPKRISMPQSEIENRPLCSASLASSLSASANMISTHLGYTTIACFPACERTGKMSRRSRSRTPSFRHTLCRITFESVSWPGNRRTHSTIRSEPALSAAGSEACPLQLLSNQGCDRPELRHTT